MNESDFMAYDETFPDSKLCIHAPDGDIVAVDYANGQDHVMPEDETDEAFYDRISRSKQCGRNLFFEEWPVLEVNWKDPDRIY